MRLIDADRLKEEIKNKFGYSSATAFVRNMQNLSQVEVFKHIMKLIEVAPMIEERPTGEWIKITKDGIMPVEYICSKCGRKIFDNHGNIVLIKEFYPFCHCGAKMKGAEK